MTGIRATLPLTGLELHTMHTALTSLIAELTPALQECRDERGEIKPDLTALHSVISQRLEEAQALHRRITAHL